jgi:putative nucleotidyltransferase with HDIG domain
MMIDLYSFSPERRILMNALEIPFPDSSVAQAANQLVLEVSPPFLYYHCVRTYAFANALGSRDKLRYDQELLYLGALLHDLGLTSRFDDNHPFEITGANAARTFLLQQEIPAEKAEIVHRAIALHLLVEAEQQRPEIALVHFWAIMDARGYRLEDVPSELLHQILEAYPRLGFKQAFAEALTAQARKKPTSAVAVAIRNGALNGLLQAPFPD